MVAIVTGGASGLGEGVALTWMDGWGSIRLGESLQQTRDKPFEVFEPVQGGDRKILGCTIEGRPISLYSLI